MKVEIFSDVICPWCYIGHTRFARAAEAFRAKGGTLEVVMRPFQLNPDATTEGEPLVPFLEEKYGPGVSQMFARVSNAAEQEGLKLDYDAAVSANTAEAHRLIAVATAQGLGEEMAQRLFRAYFTEGRNVADPEVLAGLAAEVGVRDQGEDAEVSGHEVSEQLARARRLGITGVPLFLFEEKYSVSGAQPYESFVSVIDEVAERTGQQPVTTLAAPADGCDDDGYCPV
ncbi:DsbA family oxidoreductase [Nonomuraea longicatena]|uniref:DsbA family oxidoreductase n=1 Tax=Nonomuraea longicatena TaxID=83682 RepID=A0ABP3Z5M8_9ACTN